MAKYFRLIALVLALAALPAHAMQKRLELVTTSGDGAAPIEAGDYIAARQKARDRAMEQAIWKAIATLAPPEQVEKNKDAINGAVVPKGMNFVHSYRFSDERIDFENRAYRVSMVFSFFAEYLSRSLEKGGLKVTEKPKAVVIVDERTNGILGDAGLLLMPSATEDTLREAVADAGYKVFGRAKVRALKNDDQVVNAVGGDAAAVKWLAAQYGAELVIIGATKAAQQENSMSTVGTVSVKVYDGAGGAVSWMKEVAESVEGKTGADKFRAVRAGGEKMGELLLEYLESKKPVPAPPLSSAPGMKPAPAVPTVPAAPAPAPATPSGKAAN